MNTRQITDLLLRLDRLLYDHQARSIDPILATVQLDRLEAFWHREGWPIPVQIDVARSELEANDPQGYRTLQRFRLELERRQARMYALADAAAAAAALTWEGTTP